MIRDLTEIAVELVREERLAGVREKARSAAEERVLDLLLPPLPPAAEFDEQAAALREQANRTREKLREQLREGRLDHKQVEIDVREKSFPSFEIIAGSSVEEVDINVKDMLPGLFQGRTKKRRVPHPRRDRRADAGRGAEAGRHGQRRPRRRRARPGSRHHFHRRDRQGGRDARAVMAPTSAAKGVQRDILPIVEGTTVNTKYGMVRTDHILFIAAGAFHVSKPSDLIPELQGRFPIRVELETLGREDFVRILTEPKNALVRQYTALLSTEGVALQFQPDAIDRIADFAMLVNERTENIGARRLHTVMEKLLDHDFVRCAGSHREGDHHRRRLCRFHAERDRQERRSLALYPVARVINDIVKSARGPVPRSAVRPPRHPHRALVLTALFSCACGKRGAPLAPLNLMPEPPSSVTGKRVNATVYVQMIAPKRNANGPGVVSLDHLEVYAVTLRPGLMIPANRDLLTPQYLVGQIADQTAA